MFDGSNPRVAYTISPDSCGECLTGVVSSTNTVLISENDSKVHNFMHSCTVQTSCLLCCKTHRDVHLYRVMSGRRVGKLIAFGHGDGGMKVLVLFLLAYF